MALVTGRADAGESDRTAVQPGSVSIGKVCAEIHGFRSRPAVPARNRVDRRRAYMETIQGFEGLMAHASPLAALQGSQYKKPWLSFWTPWLVPFRDRSVNEQGYKSARRRRTVLFRKLLN